MHEVEFQNVAEFIRVKVKMFLNELNSISHGLINLQIRFPQPIIRLLFYLIIGNKINLTLYTKYHILSVDIFILSFITFLASNLVVIFDLVFSKEI